MQTSAAPTPRRPRFLARFAPALLAVEGSAEGREIPLERQTTVLGRGPGVDVELADDALSKRHAVFEVCDEGVRVRDLGSADGTFVNGRLVDSQELEPGDRIALGDHQFEYRLEERGASR